jgi:predicted transcriptional regulator
VAKDKGGRLSVFKGREARLNKVIFHILALESPLTIYEIAKEVKRQRLLHRKLYSVISRRVRKLEEQGYLSIAGTKKTRPGITANTYELTSKLHLAILLNKTDHEQLLQKADNTTIIDLLAALTRQPDLYSFRPVHNEDSQRTRAQQMP